MEEIVCVGIKDFLLSYPTPVQNSFDEVHFVTSQNADFQNCLFYRTLSEKKRNISPFLGGGHATYL